MTRLPPHDSSDPNQREPYYPRPPRVSRNARAKCARTPPHTSLHLGLRLAAPRPTPPPTPNSLHVRAIEKRHTIVKKVLAVRARDALASRSPMGRGRGW